jgi:hypothetical protein
MASTTSQRFACVVGAPRSGTTSLSTFLKGHPQVCFSVVKEPHFFSQHDLSHLPEAVLRDLLETDYLDRYFPHRHDHADFLAEGSVSYLYAPERMMPILRQWPDARFVIAVRDPMQMLPSLHQRLLYLGDEVVPDFAQAWSLAASRQLGLNVPPSCVDPRFLDYRRIGQLGRHVERFISMVGEERCMVVLFEDLVADSSAVYQDLLDFLDLPYHPRADFAPQRASRHFRLGPLQRMLKRPPMMRSAGIRDSYRCTINMPAESRAWPVRSLLALRKALLRWNRRTAPPKSIAFELRARIREAYLDDVQLLSRTIGRDLRHWLATDTGAIARPARSEIRLVHAGQPERLRPAVPIDQI